LLVLFIDLARPRSACEPLPRDETRGVGDHARLEHGWLPGDGFRLCEPWMRLGKRWPHGRGVQLLLLDVRLFSGSY
jgi:hypothetical protein